MRFEHILKFNPYHDEGGRFSEEDGAHFVSIGGVFDKQRAKSPPEKPFIPAITLKEARKLASDMGAAPILTTKKELYAEVLAQRDARWERFSPEERKNSGFFDQGEIKPSLNPKEVKNVKWVAEEFYKHEKKFEGKDPFAVPEETQLLMQNLINYNHTLPKHRQAVEKFGNAKVVPFLFGKRTGLVAMAGGQQTAGMVFMNAEWHPKSQHEKDYSESFNPKGRTTEGKAAYLNGGLAGTLRHEYGHYIHSEVMPRGKAKAWDALHEQVSGLPAKQNHHDTFMGYDKDTVLKNISSYAQTNSMESFAETYALMTSKKFNKKDHHPSVHPLFDFMEREVFRG